MLSFLVKEWSFFLKELSFFSKVLSFFVEEGREFGKLLGKGGFCQILFSKKIFISKRVLEGSLFNQGRGRQENQELGIKKASR